MSFRVIQQGNGGKRDVVLMYLVGDRAQELASRVGPDACVVAEVVSNYSSEVTPWRKALEAVGAGSDFEVGRIWLIGFSAGCQGVRAQLNEGCPADVVLACDGIHGSRPTPTEAQTASWLRLASYARSGRAVFSVSCSKTPATTFLTTEDMAKVTFGWNGCYGSYSSPCVDRDGDFRIYGATNGGGSPADEHMDQLRKLLPRMIDDAKSGVSLGWGIVVTAAVLLGLAVWYELAETEDSNDDAVLQLDFDSLFVFVFRNRQIRSFSANDADFVLADGLCYVTSLDEVEVVKLDVPAASLR
jgi:hypothetical protein